MHSRLLSALAGACAISMALAAPAQASPFDDLKGSWRGSGTISPLGGAPEPVRCRATYGGSGRRLTQKLVCSAASFSLAINANMTVNNEQLSGSWSESSFGASGNVSGLARGNIIHARINGDKFDGRMSIRVSPGSHSISLQQTDPGSGALKPVATISMRR